MLVAILLFLAAPLFAMSRWSAQKPAGFVPLAVLLASLGAYAHNAGYFSRVAPVPSSPAGPDLVEAFKTNDDRAQAKHHAQAFSAICAALAEVLDYDGHLPEPRIKTGVQVDDLRRWTRENHLAGHSFAAKYPGLRKAVEDHLTSALGTSGKNLTPEQRAKWVAAFRELSASAEYAASH